VINALIINAREAMPHGGTVRVSANNIEIDANSGLPIRGGCYVKVQVADTGGGIDARSVTKIFDPYFTTKPSASGLGPRVGLCPPARIRSGPSGVNEERRNNRR
jgi:signal transduction histidine kinase